MFLFHNHSVVSVTRSCQYHHYLCSDEHFLSDSKITACKKGFNTNNVRVTKRCHAWRFTLLLKQM